MQISVLNKVSRNSLFLNPFPFIYIKNCLPEEIYSQLEKEYPSDDEIITKQKWNLNIKQNQRIDLNASQFIKNKENYSDLWNSFIEYHTSKSFFNEVINLFDPFLEKYYKEKAIFLKENCNIGIRYTDNDIHPISLDCQIGINTPTKIKSSVKGPHVDSPEELFGGFLYFKEKYSKAIGGDFEIYRWKEDEKKLFTGNYVSLKKIEKLLTIKYEPNSFILFLNSLDAVHGVSERNISRSSRRLVNIIGEVYNKYPDGLFEIPQTKKGILRKGIKFISSPLSKKS